MTTVYGVTFVGARDQIEKQLKDRKDLPEEECWDAAAYLAKKVGWSTRSAVACPPLTISIFSRLCCVSVICSVVQRASRPGSIFVHA
jgi:DNA-directed RNA polymerase